MASNQAAHAKKRKTHRNFLHVFYDYLLNTLVDIVLLVVILLACLISTIRMLRWYQARLASRPLVTQSITTAVLFATGDVLAQQIVEDVGSDKHDLARTGRMALYGGAIFGPAATTWYKILQSRINFRSQTGTIVARVLADQTIFASTNLFVFLSTMAILEGSDPKAKLKSTYAEALKKNWMVWPAVQFVNFRYVPLEHRVMVVNVVSIGWNCYLSYLNSKG
ncbi:Protein required for ethanol metabolism [Xylographa opegraphella]|nr:Protein required for ethanol metabolism [Xylographa opegraphella]